ncbi:MAG TPA: TetR/AcrR family transcriptional regulator [Nocardioides sp.]|nr:TetR/AcrR family transcriptional regulator [Nocardioides sp.]
MSQEEERPRIWAGRTMAERQSERRDQLIRAGIELVARGGGQAVTVRSVCREAGLTSRYFYEQFPDREDYLAAVFQSVADSCQTAISEAVARASSYREVATAAVDAVIGMALDDPVRGRVLFVAPATDPVLFACRQRFLPIVGEMIAEQIPDRDGHVSRMLKSASLVGALSYDFNLYVDGALDVPRADFVTHCVDLLVTVAAL